MKPEVVTRRIEAFHQRFGEAHLDFAYHAAFPLALTPDLLYRLWANFQRDRNGEALKIPWLAVADLLLSSLCDEVGYELYEMETEVRNALLRELKVNPRFGEKRIHELSDFLLIYVKQQLDSHDPDMRDFAQVQRWTALAYTKPGEAAREIASTLAALKLEEKAEWVRMASVVETFAEPLAGFEPLLIYSRGMASFVRGKRAKALTELSQVARQEDKLKVAGVNLSIPESLVRQIEGNTEPAQPFKKQETELKLEQPEGQIPLESDFYVEHPPIETDCYETILKPGALIRITGPRQMGKSSLMKRILDHASKESYKTAFVDFQSVDRELLDNLDLFLQWFAASITDALNLPEKLEDYWQGVLGSKNKCTNYFERYLLPSIDTPVALGLDEVDEVFMHPAIANDFFGLLRAWHERAKNDPVWKKLRLIIVHSQQVYVPLNINQSPFNVGLRIELPELNQAQVQDLVKRHRLNWTRKQVEQLMILVGGHPYLVRVALYQIARGRMTLEKLQQIAPTDEGPYSDHLRRHLLNLQENAELLVAFTKVISANNPLQIKTAEAFKLRCMGLIKLQGDFAMPSCELYRQYFGDRLGSDSVPEEPAQVQSPGFKKILILSANPTNTNKLRLDEEVREIQAGMERSRSRDRFEIICKWAVRSSDLRRALLDHKPEIVHFSGHGAGSEGLALENNSGQMQLVKTKTLAGLFELFDSIECVLLNACYSEAQAEAIYQHVDYVIGMNRAIGDRAAIKFAVGFYHALGADRSYEDAYKFGCLNIDLEGVPESSSPVLKARESQNKANSINVSVQSPRLKKILILSANPTNTNKLRLDEEVREIQAGMERSRSRDRFEIIYKWAVRSSDLRRALLDHKPEIVHFSGHGAGSEGLALENNSGQMELVKSETLKGLFELFDNIECVLLNACYSEAQAEAISQHVDWVIGMNRAIGDRAAIEFAVGFYDALGADRSYEDAYKFGCLNIDLEGIPESSTPVLKTRKSQIKGNSIKT